MRIKTVLWILVFQLILFSCHISKSGLFEEQPELPEVFHETISFTENLGLIVLPVSIKGKKYQFLFDTGAVTVIDKSLDSILNFKKLGSVGVRDVHENRKKQEVCTVDSLSLGSVKFSNIHAVVVDLNASPELSCLKISGIIGASLMKQCKWKIDPYSKTVEISNESNSLKEKGFTIIPFKEKNHGTPIIDVRVNGVVFNDVTLDFGCNGALSLSKEDVANIVDTSVGQSVLSIGYGSSGLYGATMDTSIWFNADVGIDSLTNTPSKVVAQNRNGRLIGTKFFKNYIILFDWEENMMYYKKGGSLDPMDRMMMELSPFYLDGNIVIGSVVYNSMAWIQGIRPLDTLKEFQQKPINEPTQEDYCETINLFRENPGTYVLKTTQKELFIGNSLMLNELEIR